MTIGGYLFIAFLVAVGGVYLYARGKYKKNKPKELVEEFRKDKRG